ncbi:MAG: NAD(P)/FAD-dependent oxidoreductase [Chitinophagaceae bacterium]|nr:NAD(P)/FAD-dependent oxidoreductase [Chitinophagaceae bacterium]
MKNTKVFIVGAGPAGAAASLQLAKMGIACVIADKAVFPRDKVCGDGLSGKVIAALNRIDPEITARLHASPFTLNSWGVTFASPGRHSLDVGCYPGYDSTGDGIREKPMGYVCTRLEFDNFLIEEIKRCPQIELLQGVCIDTYERVEDGYIVTDDTGIKTKADILIIANGAHSSFTREIAGITMEPKHYMAGVRAYYQNVQGNHPDNFIELHFLKHLLPGYFWVFPLPSGRANVGVGMLSEAIRSKKIHLKKTLLDIVKNDPVFKERFKEAELIGGIEGYGLPLGSKRRKISGDRYMLAGDAAYLIDPFTGEGIGNGIYSGRIAALTAASALKENNFSAKRMAAYDAEVYRILGPELKLSYRIQQLVRFPWLFDKLIKIGSRNKQLRELLSGMFYEVNLRKKLTKPSFYVRMLLNR